MGFDSSQLIRDKDFLSSEIEAVKNALPAGTRYSQEEESKSATARWRNADLDLERRIENMEKGLNGVECKLDYIENQSRRNNLRIDGL